MKENLGSIVVVVCGVLTLLGVLSKSVTDYFVGIRATRTSLLLAADKAQAERTTEVETRMKVNSEKIEVLQSKWVEAENGNTLLMKQIAQQEIVIARLKDSYEQVVKQNELLQKENSLIPELRSQLADYKLQLASVQERCRKLESSVAKNTDAIGNTGS